MKKRWWIILLVVIVVLGVVGYGAWRRFSAQQTANQEQAAETAVVRRDTLRVTINGTGSLAPQMEVGLVFTSGGRVAEVLVEEGQMVPAGQPLIRLETAELELQVIQAEAGLASAEAQLAKLLAPLSLDEQTIAWLTLQQAESALESAQGAYDRVSWRPDIGMLPQSSNLQKATLDYQRALADYNLAVQGALDEDIIISEASVTQAEVGLQQALLRLEQATLVAPFAGTVTALNVQPGEMASAGQAMVILSDLQALEISVNLDETDISQVAVGQEVVVILDAFPDVELAGVVTTIAPVAQVQSGVVLYPVTIQLLADVDGPDIRAGMTAEVEIVTTSREGVLIVPLRAVQSMGENHFVMRQLAEGQTPTQFTPPGGMRPGGGEGRPGGVEGRENFRDQILSSGFEPVPVTLGVMTDTEVEITSGLEEGDVVSVVPLATQDSQRPGGPMGGIFGGMRGGER